MINFKNKIFSLIREEIRQHSELRIFVFSGTPCVDWSSLGSSNGLQRRRPKMLTMPNNFELLLPDDKDILRSCFESANIGENGVWGVVQEHRHILEKVREKNNVPRKKEESANYQVLQMLELFGWLMAEFPNVEFCFENGEKTYMWAAIEELQNRIRQPAGIVATDFAEYLHMFANGESIKYITSALKDMAEVGGDDISIVCDCCRFGACWKKKTRFGTNSTSIVKEFRDEYWTCENGGYCQEVHTGVCDLPGSMTAASTSAYPTRFCELFAKVVMCGSSRCDTEHDSDCDNKSSSRSSSPLSSSSSSSTMATKRGNSDRDYGSARGSSSFCDDNVDDALKTTKKRRVTMQSDGSGSDDSDLL